MGEQGAVVAGEKPVGTPSLADNADEFRALYAYSPVHNVRAATCYPPTLVTTAAAGLISVRFVDATHGTLIFVNDTYVVTKPVTRMLF